MQLELSCLEVFGEKSLDEWFYYIIIAVIFLFIGLNSGGKHGFWSALLLLLLQLLMCCVCKIYGVGDWITWALRLIDWVLPDFEVACAFYIGIGVIIFRVVNFLY
jgi:hypothetical protein